MRFLSIVTLCFGMPLSLNPAQASGDRERACRGDVSCFIALDGRDRGLCQAYVENSSCFMALDGDDRGWCEVLKEGKSCFMALNGEARRRCEDGKYPRSHMYWANCR